MERIQKYLKEHGDPAEYDIEDLEEKYLLLDWVACQLCFKRSIKTKQLFLYGEPSTQKALIFHFLSRVLRIYFANSRGNDFARADNYYDLWVFDDFHEPKLEDVMASYPYPGGATPEGLAFAKTIYKILDGQECRLDSKDSRVFKKPQNAPAVMITNELPNSTKMFESYAFT